MKLVKPTFEIIKQESGINGIYKHIERAGRTCYHSQDRITSDSAKEFYDRMVKSKHWAMLEHGTVYLAVPRFVVSAHDLPVYNDWHRLIENKYSRADFDGEYYFITTNMRVLVEHEWLYALKYLVEPWQYHERRYTVKFTTGIDITREFNRHRVNSMAEESTRFCTYTKDKFGNEISVIPPQGIDYERYLLARSHWGEEDLDIFTTMCGCIWQRGEDDFCDIDLWIFANLACQWSYMGLVGMGWKPQIARKVLPLDLKSELVHTAFASDWKHFFELRCAEDAHPDARALAIPLREEFKKRGYI